MDGNTKITTVDSAAPPETASHQFSLRQMLVVMVYLAVAYGVSPRSRCPFGQPRRRS